jgi:1-acyl-sn-glycerol-3-phosphate acyltransferase
MVLDGGAVTLVRATVRSIQLAGYFLKFGGELVLKRPATREARAAWLHRFCSSAMRGLGIGVDVVGSYPERGILISNHTGYVDIVTYAALHPCVFCSKAEVRTWPGMGWLATMAGTVFVERGRGGSALEAKSEMQAAVDAGVPVVFFPEGTTTNGTELLPFHSGLLAQAMALGAPVTVAFLHYTLTEDNGPGATVENDVCYWGDVSLLRHIVRFLGLRGVRVEVRFAAQPLALAAGENRKQFAVEARSAVFALAEQAGRSLRDAAAKPGG